jgi:serine/threonine protein kinase
MALTSGTKLGPYEIRSPLGSGGMGEVYRATDACLGRDVAIKVCAERFSERFGYEAHAIAALNHSNICRLYDVGPNYLVSPRELSKSQEEENRPNCEFHLPPPGVVWRRTWDWF